MDTKIVQGDAYFTRINELPRQYPYLTSDVETEVIIIGGGVTGAIVGYYLTKAQIPTVLLEKGRLAHGSSAITTALLQYELDSNAAELLADFSPDKVEAAYRLGLEALEALSSIIEDCGNRCCYTPADSVLYTQKREQVGLIKEEFRYRQSLGLPVSFFSEGAAPFPFPTQAALIAKGGGAKLDPFLFAHQLLEEGTLRGLRVYENSEAVNIQYNADHVIVETVYGHRVKGQLLICATGYDTSLFGTRAFGTKSTTFNIVTKPIPNLEEILDQSLFRDNEDPYHYFRTTPDKGLIIGGEDIDFDPHRNLEAQFPHSYSLLEQRLKDLFPQYPIEVAYRYCGAFASTKDNLGFIGRDPKHKRLWYCLGYGANGILYALQGGKLLTKLYEGEADPKLMLFKPDRF